MKVVIENNFRNQREFGKGPWNIGPGQNQQ